MISVTNCDATLNKLPELCIWLSWHFDVCFVSYSSWLSCQMACWLRLLRTTPRSPRCRWSSTAGRGLRRATMLESPTACELRLDWYVRSLHISCIGIISDTICHSHYVVLFMVTNVLLHHLWSSCWNSLNLGLISGIESCDLFSPRHCCSMQYMYYIH